MNLMVDMGNSRLKWAIWQNGQMTTGSPLFNDQLTEQGLMGVWQDLPTPQRLAISSVSANYLQELLISVATRLWPDLEIVPIKAQARAFGVINAYHHPESLGVDRWLALVAAKQHYPTPACIVDCGTAITIDLIDASGQHLGGLISPGLRLMKHSLAVGTDRLMPSNNSFSPGLANKTEAAIYSGTLACAVGLIEHVLRKHPDNHLLLTGGDASLVADQLQAIKPQIDADLVLRGLAIALEGQS